MSQPSKPALAPPAGELVVLSQELMASTLAYSRSSSRRRVIQPFHKTPSDALQRMFNAVQPDSYIRPHRHLEPPKGEAWILLSGALLFFTFEDDGRVRDSLRLSAGGDAFGVDLVPGVYHSFIALEPDTLIYDVKSGPYIASNDTVFAPWAPAEGDSGVAAYVASLRSEFERRQR